MGTLLHEKLNQLTLAVAPEPVADETRAKQFIARHEYAVKALKIHADAIRKRGRLLLDEIDDEVFDKVKNPGHAETQRVAFNRYASAYLERRHTVLQCVVMEVSEVNTLCMTRQLAAETLFKAFEPIEDPCDVEGQIKQRYEMVSKQIEVFTKEIRSSPFLSAGKDAEAQVPKKPAPRRKVPAKAKTTASQKTSS